MATSFFLMTKKEEGEATLFVRLQSRKHSINYKMATQLTVDIKEWNNAYGNFRNWRQYCRAHPDLADKLHRIQSELNNSLGGSTPIGKEEMREIVRGVVYAEAREAELKRKEEKATQKRMTLNKYIALYCEQIAVGARQTDKGRNYAPSTVKTIRLALDQFAKFQKETGREFDFDDIDLQFYYDFTAYLKSKGYSINTNGKCIKELKTILASAESEGYHNNHISHDKKFKGTRVDVDSIYLTKEDLDAMMQVDLSTYPASYAKARDIFMIGVWTAQRISDYNHIQKEDFNTLTKNVLKEAPDPQHPGHIKAWIESREITYLNIRQQKTGAKVAIPCNSALKAILEKYNYRVPHLSDQVINRHIKEIAHAAGLTQLIEIETTKGGVPRKEMMEKYRLVHSHTARRTGATLMYLAGVDLYDIMKVTGHASPKMLKKYIKADLLEVVEKLTDKYEYFR